MVLGDLFGGLTRVAWPRDPVSATGRPADGVGFGFLRVGCRTEADGDV